MKNSVRSPLTDFFAGVNFHQRRGGIKRNRIIMMCRSAKNRVRKCMMYVRQRSQGRRSVSKSEVQVSIVLENRSETSHFDSAPVELMRFDSAESVLHSRATQNEEHVERRGSVKGKLISRRDQDSVRKKIASKSRFSSC